MILIFICVASEFREIAGAFDEERDEWIKRKGASSPLRRRPDAEGQRICSKRAVNTLLENSP